MECFLQVHLSLIAGGSIFSRNNPRLPFFYFLVKLEGLGPCPLAFLGSMVKSWVVKRVLEVLLAHQPVVSAKDHMVRE